MTYTLGNNYKILLEISGVHTEFLYKKFHLPYSANRDIEVTRETYIALMNEIDTQANYVTIASMCDVKKLSSFNPAVYAGLCAQNGFEAFKRLANFKKVVGPFAIDIIENEDIVKLVFTFDNNKDVPKLLQVTECAIVLSLVQIGTGKKIMPHSIESMSPYDKELTNFFGVTTVGTTNNSISFLKEDLLEPFITENNIMWEYLEPELTRRVKLMESEQDICKRVRNILNELIPANKATIDNVAFELALSTRTLQRKLQAQNTSFMIELNNVKETLAKRLLLKKELDITQVSYLLGYSDPSSFMRAFNQWTGMTVNEFRKKG